MASIDSSRMREMYLDDLSNFVDTDYALNSGETKITANYLLLLSKYLHLGDCETFERLDSRMSSFLDSFWKRDGRIGYNRERTGPRNPSLYERLCKFELHLRNHHNYTIQSIYSINPQLGVLESLSDENKGGVIKTLEESGILEKSLEGIRDARERIENGTITKDEWFRLSDISEYSFGEFLKDVTQSQ